MPRRRWSGSLRWVGPGAAALLAAGVLLVAPSAVPRAVPSAGADNCPDVALTFARGTDEPAGLGRVGQSLADDLRQNTGKNIDAYPVNYKASLLQLHGGDGANDAIKHIKDVADKCPNTPQVLGGYSQGASVIDIVTGVPIGGIGWGGSLPPQYANNIVAVTTFGNPADRSGGPISAQSAAVRRQGHRFLQPRRPDLSRGPRQPVERAHRGLRARLHQPGGQLRSDQAVVGATPHRAPRAHGSAAWPWARAWATAWACAQSRWPTAGERRRRSARGVSLTGHPPR